MNAPLWEYAHSERLAADDDAYFQHHPLLKADVAALDERFREPGPLVDLGCGTGRLALHFASRGFAVVAVDLARPMLRLVRAKASTQKLDVSLLEANLCRLDCLRDHSFRYALSMFSTLGMVRGAASRRRALSEAYRILKPRGRLALHAHNLWLNLRNAQGRRWLLAEGWKALSRRAAPGDRRMTYRGVPGMEVHLYRWRELKSELQRAGFVVEDVLAIEEVNARPIRAALVPPRPSRRGLDCVRPQAVMGNGDNN